MGIYNRGDILEGLFNSNKIFQTGSRYWDNLDPELIPITNETDWDFVAEYDEKLIDYLKQFGFEENNLGIDESDGHTKMVLYYDKTIQVILKKNVERYLEVQEAISPEFYKKFLWKKYTDKELISERFQLLYKARNIRDVINYINENAKYHR